MWHLLSWSGTDACAAVLWNCNRDARPRSRAREPCVARSWSGTARAGHSRPPRHAVEDATRCRPVITAIADDPGHLKRPDARRPSQRRRHASASPTACRSPAAALRRVRQGRRADDAQESLTRSRDGRRLAWCIDPRRSRCSPVRSWTLRAASSAAMTADWHLRPRVRTRFVSSDAASSDRFPTSPRRLSARRGGARRCRRSSDLSRSGCPPLPPMRGFRWREK